MPLLHDGEGLFVRTVKPLIGLFGLVTCLDVLFRSSSGSEFWTDIVSGASFRPVPTAGPDDISRLIAPTGTGVITLKVEVFVEPATPFEVGGYRSLDAVLRADVMVMPETAALVPVDGPKARRRSSFTFNSSSLDVSIGADVDAYDAAIAHAASAFSVSVNCGVIIKFVSIANSVVRIIDDVDDGNFASVADIGFFSVGYMFVFTLSFLPSAIPSSAPMLSCFSPN
jgi:hypothetical protein